MQQPHLDQRHMMSVVGPSKSDLEALLSVCEETDGSPICIAVFMSPTEHTVAGNPTALKALQQLINDELPGARTKSLGVTAPFHHPQLNKLKYDSIVQTLECEGLLQGTEICL